MSVLVPQLPPVQPFLAGKPDPDQKWQGKIGLSDEGREKSLQSLIPNTDMLAQYGLPFECPSTECMWKLRSRVFGQNHQTQALKHFSFWNSIIWMVIRTVSIQTYLRFPDRLGWNSVPATGKWWKDTPAHGASLPLSLHPNQDTTFIFCLKFCYITFINLCI